MEFPYVNIEGCFMPMLKVTLRKGEHEIDAEALVDSGSMRNIFDAELASLLGNIVFLEGMPDLFRFKMT